MNAWVFLTITRPATKTLSRKSCLFRSICSAVKRSPWHMLQQQNVCWWPLAKPNSLILHKILVWAEFSPIKSLSVTRNSITFMAWRNVSNKSSHSSSTPHRAWKKRNRFYICSAQSVVVNPLWLKNSRSWWKKYPSILSKDRPFKNHRWVYSTPKKTGRFLKKNTASLFAMCRPSCRPGQPSACVNTTAISASSESSSITLPYWIKFLYQKPNPVMKITRIFPLWWVKSIFANSNNMNKTTRMPTVFPAVYVNPTRAWWNLWRCSKPPLKCCILC